jgi:hypothetical protein
VLTETPKRFAPIETRYGGYRFRSRLEARLAYFLDRVHDAITRQWVYEPEGFRLGDDYYLPDFFLPNFGPHGTYLEVKPGPPPAHSVPQPREQMLLDALFEATGSGCVLVYGDPYDVFVSRCEGALLHLGSGRDWARFLYRERLLSTELAAKMARQIRFEHGEAA